MRLAQVLWFYIIWHYTKAWSDMTRVVGNYLWFIANFFSINLLLRTLFSPWRRLSVSGGRRGEESLFGAFVINFLMRFVGFFMRLFTALLGVLSLLATMAVAFAAALAWLFLPAILFFLLFAGIGYMAAESFVK